MDYYNANPPTEDQLKQAEMQHEEALLVLQWRLERLRKDPANETAARLFDEQARNEKSSREYVLELRGRLEWLQACCGDGDESDG